MSESPSLTGSLHQKDREHAHNPESFPRVHGHCPMGCGQTLFLGSGGYVTCSWLGCPDPCAADDLLWKKP